MRRLIAAVVVGVLGLAATAFAGSVQIFDTVRATDGSGIEQLDYTKVSNPPDLNAYVQTNDEVHVNAITGIVDVATSGPTGSVTRTGRGLQFNFPEPGTGIDAVTATGIASAVVADYVPAATRWVEMVNGTATVFEVTSVASNAVQLTEKSANFSVYATGYESVETPPVGTVFLWNAGLEKYIASYGGYSWYVRCEAYSDPANTTYYMAIQTDDPDQPSGYWQYMAIGEYHNPMVLPQTLVGQSDYVGTGTVDWASTSVTNTYPVVEWADLLPLLVEEQIWPPNLQRSDYTVTTNINEWSAEPEVTLTDWVDLGTGTNLVIPDYIDGYPVTICDIVYGAGSPITSVTGGAMLREIAANEFDNCAALTSVTLSSTSILGIGATAFRNCTALTDVIFSTDAPDLGDVNVFDGATQVVVRVTNPTATGWGATFGGRPVVRSTLAAPNATDDGKVVMLWEGGTSTVYAVSLDGATSNKVGVFYGD